MLVLRAQSDDLCAVISMSYDKDYFITIHKALVLWLTLLLSPALCFRLFYSCMFARGPQYGGGLLGLGSVFTPGQTSSH